MPPPSRAPYRGPHRKLVVGFDIGTTFSGISYCILSPGEVPETKSVTRFPSQEHVGGDSKIPTVICYDASGKVRAVGAEAVREGLEELIEDEKWVRAEWFKMHLRPKFPAGKDHQEAKKEDVRSSTSKRPAPGDADGNDSRAKKKPRTTRNGATVTMTMSDDAGNCEPIPPLPPNKTVIDLFADFMKYLYECLRTYIHETYADGSNIWTSVQQNDAVEFILTHPNGWEGAQQVQMRRAAVQGGLVPNTNAGRARVHFVTEGEASLHFCIQNGLTTSAIDKGEGVLVVDAGGGTIDISAYSKNLTSKSSSFQEIAASKCLFQGSIFVTNKAKDFLKGRLLSSKFKRDINEMARRFDKSTKLTFRNRDEPQFIKFGGARDTDAKLNIRAGQLKLSGDDVATFFEPAVNAIVDAVAEQRTASKTPITSVFLVGGFAASNWLFTQLKTKLEPLGITFCRPDSHVNKGVADGCVSYSIDHIVTSRISKYVYGHTIYVPYDSAKKDHVARSSKIFVDERNIVSLGDIFRTVLAKDLEITEVQEFRRRCCRMARTRAGFGTTISTQIWCYRGKSSSPYWLDEDRDNFSPICTIVVPVSEIEKSITTERAADSSIYFKFCFDIILKFGLAELTAQVCWKEGGKEHRSPVEIVYDPPDILAAAAH